MSTTFLYNPSKSGNIEKSGFLKFQQLPLPGIYVDSPIDVFGDFNDFKADLLSYSTFLRFGIGSDDYDQYGALYEDVPQFSVVGKLKQGVTANTDGTIFDGLIGYETIPYIAGAQVNGTPIKNQIATFSADQYTGYGAFSTHTANLPDFTGNLQDILNFDPDSIELVPIANNPVVFDAAKGFQLSFTVAVLQEDTIGNTAGFTVTLITEDGSGVELGFSDGGSGNPDRIFAHDANFGTLVETEVASINQSTKYDLFVKGDQFYLSRQGSILLSGDLLNFNFNPLTSDPALPFNPYTTANLLSIGDITDGAWSEFRLGAVRLAGLKPSTNKRFKGTKGTDVYEGGSGNNTINGAGGDDVLFGGGGNDTINGGAGNDRMYGGEGDDTFILSAGFDVVDGGPESTLLGDSLLVRGYQFLTVSVGATADFPGQTSDFTAEVGNIATKAKQIQTTKSITKLGVSQNFNLSRFAATAFTSIESMRVQGTKKADVLDASQFDGVVTAMNGGAGNDVLLGSKGGSTLNGGGGSDELYGQEGDDVLIGGGGNDLIVGGGGYDRIQGGKGKDTIVVGAEYAQAGDDDFARIIGFKNDILLLIGEEGDYTFSAVTIDRSGESISGLGVYLDAQNDLVAILQGVSLGTAIDVQYEQPSVA